LLRKELKRMKKRVKKEKEEAKKTEKKRKKKEREERRQLKKRDIVRRAVKQKKSSTIVGLRESSSKLQLLKRRINKTKSVMLEKSFNEKRKICDTKGKD